MAVLLFRRIDEGPARVARDCDDPHRRSAEVEHGASPAEALDRRGKRSLAEVLAEIPDAGTDADFERVDPTAEPPLVFD
jgi:hypothetical protein